MHPIALALIPVVKKALTHKIIKEIVSDKGEILVEKHLEFSPKKAIVAVPTAIATLGIAVINVLAAFNLITLEQAQAINHIFPIIVTLTTGI